MSTRYLSNVAVALIGGLLLVTSQAFASGPFGWIMLGAGILALVVTLAAATSRSRGSIQRGLDAVVALFGGWTIVASLVFGGIAVTWLGFASGAVFAVLALAGLTAHELSTERVVHSFEVHKAAGVRSAESAGDDRRSETIQA